MPLKWLQFQDKRSIRNHRISMKSIIAKSRHEFWSQFCHLMLMLLWDNCLSFIIFHFLHLWNGDDCFYYKGLLYRKNDKWNLKHLTQCLGQIRCEINISSLKGGIIVTGLYRKTQSQKREIPISSILSLIWDTAYNLWGTS